MSHASGRGVNACLISGLSKTHIYLLENSRYRERGKEIFHSLVHSPDDGNGQCWARPKPGVRSFIQISNMGARAQTFGPCSAAFPDALAGNGIGSGAAGLERALYGMLASRAVALPTRHTAGPWILF